MARARVTAGDVWRPYIKPSLKGRLVIRKRNTVFRPASIEKFWANQWGWMRRNTPSTRCAGLSIQDFRVCLREQMLGQVPSPGRAERRRRVERFRTGAPIQVTAV